MPGSVDDLSRSAAKVQAALDVFGLAYHVLELPDSTRTARDAAEAIGCEVGQIAKSLVFRRIESDQPLLVIASGSNLVDLDLIASHIGEGVVLGQADYVRAVTGFVIGGIPPLGHDTSIQTLIDQDLMKYDVIWAAAGTPRAVFQLTGDALLRMTGGEVLQVC